MRHEDDPGPLWVAVGLGLKFLSGTAFAALLCYAKWAGVWGCRDVPYWLLAAAPLAWPTLLLAAVLFVKDDAQR